jgi:hypothetical protein
LHAVLQRSTQVPFALTLDPEPRESAWALRTEKSQ